MIDAMKPREGRQLEDHVVLDELECRVGKESLHILAPTRDQIVDANHFVAGHNKALTEMRPDHPGSACDEDAHILELSLSAAGARPWPARAVSSRQPGNVGGGRR